jgi:hypothetical protein
MIFRNPFRAVRRLPNSFTDAPPQKEKKVTAESTEVLAVRACIAKVVEARAAHILVVRQKEASVQEVNEVTGRRAAVQTQVAAREREMALAGGELSCDPFPEDAEIARLNRHLRILQERVRICEGHVTLSQGRINAAIGELEQSWCALGAATSERLLKGFRDGAAALRDAHLGYLSLGRYFFHTWSSAAWAAYDKNLAIVDPRSRELILDPLRAQIPAKWPAVVQSSLKSLEELRAKIDAVSGKASVSPVATQEED